MKNYLTETEKFKIYKGNYKQQIYVLLLDIFCKRIPEVFTSSIRIRELNKWSVEFEFSVFNEKFFQKLSHLIETDAVLKNFFVEIIPHETLAGYNTCVFKINAFSSKELEASLFYFVLCLEK